MKIAYILLLSICMVMQIRNSQAQSGSITVGVTIAGGNGFGTAINQIDPRVMAVDTSDNLYVQDGYASRIFKFAPGATQGNIITGGGGSLAGIFTIDALNNLYIASGGDRILKWSPGATQPIVIGTTTGVDLRGLGVDAAGNVYALDYYGNRVLKYVPGSTTGIVIITGTQLYVAGVSTNFPRALSVDAPGNIYLSDDFNGRILKYNPVSGTTTIAAGGNGNGGAANQLSNPQGTFVDAGGNLYVADAGNNRIQKWPAGSTSGITVAGGNGSGAGPIQLFGPLAVCVDKSGRIYVSDNGNLRVQRFDALKAPGSPAIGVTVAGGDGSMLVAGVHVDENGNIYVADAANHRIQKFAPGLLTGITVAGGNGAGPAANQLNTPKAVFVDSIGNMYIADAVNNRVQKWAPGASSGVTVAGGNGLGNAYSQLAYPNDLFVDTSGIVYVSDYGNNRVTAWSPGSSTGGQWALRGFPGSHPTGLYGDNTGMVYVSVSEFANVSHWNSNSNLGFVAGKFNSVPGSGADELSAPAGLFVDESKTVYVADQGNHRIQKWMQGATSGITVAGGNGQGTGSTQLSSPNDVFLDAAGNMYVASGDRVQKFTTNGEGAGINYKYYEGTWTTLPDFSSLTPVKTGISANFSLNDRAQGRNDNYAFLWEGKIKIPVAGNYTFETESDDGSRLYFNMPYAYSSAPTVNNDGVHAVKSATGNVNVPAPGAYPIAISFFEKDLAESMRVYWTGPGISRQLIPDSAFISVSVENSAPTISQILHLVSKGFTYVNLDWLNSTDNVGVTGYDVYVDGVKKFTVAESRITVDSLQPNTAYKFSVKAFDLAGNRSGFSSEISVTTSPIVSGLSYKYYEGISWDSLPDFAVLRPDKTGNTPNVDIGVRTAGRNDKFAFVWEGYINIKTPGDYTFETISDDGSKLYFNSFLVPTAVATVNNNGLHAATSATGHVYIPSAGSYPIAITYFQKDGGENIQVYWSGPGIAKQLIPDAAFNPAAPPPSGFRFSYYEGSWDYLPDFRFYLPVLSGVTPNVNINLRPASRNDNFAFLWDGNINIPAPGVYTFETVSDDGSRLYFNSLFNALIPALVDNNGLHPSTSVTNSVYIPAAGSYPIAIGYFEKNGGENMQVYWSGPGIPRQLIPDNAFSSWFPHYSGINYKFYQGSWTALPDFNALTPVKTGNTSNFNIYSVIPPEVNDNFALLWEGMINVPSAGYYTFETVSDDGSKLYFNERYSATAIPVVNHDGLHGASLASGNVYVPAAGSYPIAVTFFQREGNKELKVFWSGPGVSRQIIPEYVFTQPLPPLSIMSASTGTSSGNVKAIAAENKSATRVSKVYPDPFTDRFTIDFYNPSAQNDISINIRDVTGRLMYTYRAGKLAAGNSSLNVPISGVRLSNGVYFVTLKVNGVSGKAMSLVKRTGN